MKKFHQSPKTYARLVKTIKKDEVKSISISIISDKHSSFPWKSSSLIPIIVRIIHHCWRHKVLISCWRNAVTVLVYDKGSRKDPSISRQLLLEPLTMQKGFWSDISGTTEHAESLTYLPRHAKLILKLHW